MAQINWNHLFAKGSIVDLNTGRWRARLAIKPQDLDIEDSDEVQKVLSLGQHRLAPETAFAGILEPARAAARSIDYYSMNFGLIKGARYVPDSNLEKLLGKLREYQATFNEEVEKFLENFDEMKEKQMPIIKKALEDAARDESVSREAFNRIRVEYPTKEEVRAKFRLQWNVYAIQGAKSKAAAAVAANEAEQVKDIIGTMVGQLRSELSAKVEKILAAVNRGGALSSTSVGSAMELLNKVESLNVLGDQVLAQQIVSLRAALSTVDRKNVGEDFGQGLEDIQEALEASVEEAIKQAEDDLTSVGRRKLG